MSHSSSARTTVLGDDALNDLRDVAVRHAPTLCQMRRYNQTVRAVRRSSTQQDVQFPLQQVHLLVSQALVLFLSFHLRVKSCDMSIYYWNIITIVELYYWTNISKLKPLGP